MRTVVPFAVSEPKTRLSSVLSPDERREFARAMLDDVLAALRALDREPEVLATERVDVDAPVTVDDRPLDPAINEVLETTDEAVAVVMADLALATPDALDQLFSPDADVVLAPGRGGGTNAFVARHPDFRVDYHDASIRDHRRIAAELTDDVVEVDSFRLATDVDDPSDLAEVLLHGEGEAADWLREAGFELSVDDGRVGVSR
ncbi:phospholactate guanylyltransferase [Halomicrobium zhouii]|uniref:2-phospho-L-lactate guanylyltransferase n=1 Tax=Halomicrobium zhouii TaxID=767519 RepID=A0A1I6KLQ7_9EURY|nr:2-phospho-L-lactate guanylyltransferase [Halomicrobium zhouii]SFR92129.1 phospholactate guanylyltransferase [Halomicrobium zhouii]